MIYRHRTWDEAMAYALARAGETGYRYRVGKAAVGWWLVSRVPRQGYGDLAR